MTNKELLTPRYEVIAKYPYCAYETGHIIQLYDNCESVKQWYGQYPHLFRPLHWAEKREEIEMPKYISLEGKIYEVFMWGKIGCLVEDIGILYFNSSEDKNYTILPSTEEEYLKKQSYEK